MQGIGIKVSLLRNVFCKRNAAIKLAANKLK